MNCRGRGAAGARPAADEVLIETERTLISVGSELAMLTETHQPDNLPTDGFPIDPGYSNVGTVVEVGTDVDDGLVGERVCSPTCDALRNRGGGPAPGSPSLYDCSRRHFAR